MTTTENIAKTEVTTADLRVRDLLLKALTFSSGAIDAISFLAMGKVFTAFMTGNVVFLGILMAGAGGPSALAVVVSIAAFSAGAYLSWRIVQPVSASEAAGVWPRRVTFAIGLSLIAHVAFLVVWMAVDGRQMPGVTACLLGCWAFAMGMQSAAVRSLHVDGVFTTAATATILFLAGDLAAWSATTVERRRLAGVLLALLLGAISGGWLVARAPFFAPLLPLTVTLLVVVVAATALRERIGTENRKQVSSPSTTETPH
ncbi:MAG: hypothetical protein JWL77_5256 [Chthonomonadaceae bacterium]|nr:hypothetical protein [Chthonomonadaceae bacterium]